MARVLSVLLSLAAGASAQAVVDPTSTAGQAPGTPQQTAADTANEAIAAASSVASVLTGTTGAPAQGGGGFVNPGAPGGFGETNPNAGGIGQLVNAAVDGNQAEVEAAQAAALAEAPSAAGQFVDGFIAGYLDKTTLMPGEKTCLRTESHHVAEDGIGFLSGLATIISDALEKKQQVDFMALMAGAGQLVQIGTSIETLVNSCTKSDVRGVMKVTMMHLKNPQYVQERLSANALEIVQSLSDSVKDSGLGSTTGEDHWTAVGKDFGAVLRKTLISDDHTPMMMYKPAGVMSTDIAPMIIQGVLQGMFVEGTAVKITSTVDPAIDIDVDLYRCISKEAPYVSTIVQAAYVGISMLTTAINKVTLAAKGISEGQGNGLIETPAPGINPDMTEFQQDIGPLMSNIPVLLDRCGITATQRKDMMQAFKEIKNLKAAFTIPGPDKKSAATEQATVRLNEATKYWKDCVCQPEEIPQGSTLGAECAKTENAKPLCVYDPNTETGTYTNFGVETGGLMRDLVLAIMPAPPAAGAPQLYEMVDLDASKKHAGSFALYAAGFAAFSLAALALVRARPQGQNGQTDVELAEE